MANRILRRVVSLALTVLVIGAAIGGFSGKGNASGAPRVLSGVVLNGRGGAIVALANDGSLGSLGRPVVQLGYASNDAPAGTLAALSVMAPTHRVPGQPTRAPVLLVELKVSGARPVTFNDSTRLAVVRSPLLHAGMTYRSSATPTRLHVLVESASGAPRDGV